MQPPPGATSTTQTTTTAAPAPQEPQQTDTSAPAEKKDDEGWLKPTQLVVAIIGGLVAIVATVITIWITVRKGARSAVFSILDSSEGRKALADHVLTHFGSGAGRKDFREFILEILASNDSEEQMRKLVTRLIVLRDESKDKVQQEVNTLREEVQKQTPTRLKTEIELREEQLEKSKFGRYGGDPLANTEEIIAQVTKLAASVGILPPPKEESAVEPERGRKNPPENTPKADDGD